MKKKIISFSLATVVAFGTLGTTMAETDTTELKSGPQYIQGDAKGNFNPTSEITRQEMAVMVGRAIGEESSNPNFKDANMIADWADEFVAGLQDEGIVEGDTNGNFNPTDNISRASLATIVVRAYERTTGETLSEGQESFKDLDDNAWYASAVKKAAQAGLVLGDGKGYFNPEGSASRAQSVVMINRMLGIGEESLPEDFSNNVSTDLKDSDKWPSWANNAIIAASAGFDYVTDEDGNVIVRFSTGQDRIDTAIDQAEEGSEIAVDLSNPHGDVVIETEKSLTITLDGDMGDSTLTVNAPNSTVIWDGTTSGEITIDDVSNNSFIIRRGKAKGLIFKDTNGGRVANESDESIPVKLGEKANIRLEGKFGQIESQGNGENAPKVTIGEGSEGTLSGEFGDITGEGDGDNAPDIVFEEGAKAVLKGNFGTITNNGASSIDQSEANIGNVEGEDLAEPEDNTGGAIGGGGGSSQTPINIGSIFEVSTSEITDGTRRGTLSISENNITIGITGEGTDSIASVLDAGSLNGESLVVTSEKEGTLSVGGETIDIPATTVTGDTGGLVDSNNNAKTADEIIAVVDNMVKKKVSGYTFSVAELSNMQQKIKELNNSGVSIDSVNLSTEGNTFTISTSGANFTATDGSTTGDNITITINVTII